MKSPIALKAAWITGGCAIIAAIIYGFITLIGPGSDSSPSTVNVQGNDKSNVAIVGKSDNVTINQSVQSSPESQLSGILMPANEPDPFDTCAETIPKDALKVFLGSSVSWTKKMGLHTVLTIGSRDIITLNHTAGGLFVSATIARADGREVAKIEDNHFTINPNNYFEMVRPDRHELQIYERANQLVFKVRYFNESSVLFQGKFYVPGRPGVVVSEDEIILGGNNRLKRVCAGESGRADFAF